MGAKTSNSWDVNVLLATIIKADEETLMMSRQHCHAKNVSSLVVKKEQGRLLRAFLAWPGHDCHTNHLDGEMGVGIHNHRYDISLSKIFGEIRHTTYTRSTKHRGLHEWQFRSGPKLGEPEATYVGNAGLELQSDAWLGSDEAFITSDVFHDVACYGPAAWWVHEGEQKRSFTTLFTKSLQVNTQRLYVPFGSRQQIIEHVADWVVACF